MKKNNKSQLNEVVINMENISDDSSVVPTSSCSGINNNSATSISSTSSKESNWYFCKFTANKTTTNEIHPFQIDTENLEQSQPNNDFRINIDQNLHSLNDSLTSSSSKSVVIDIENELQYTNPKICSISESVSRIEQKWANPRNKSILFAIPRTETIPGISSTVQLTRYEQNARNCIISIPPFSDDSNNDNDNDNVNTTISCLFVKTWLPTLLKIGTHVSATAILSATGFWTSWSLGSRMIGLVFGIGITKWYDDYFAKNKDNWNEKQLKKAQALKIILNSVVVAGTVIDTLTFDFSKLGIVEQERFWNCFNGLFLDEIFLNYITQYFTVEQIIAMVHNIFSSINIFTKYDNKLTKIYDKVQQLTRASLIITGFSVLFSQVLRDGIKIEDIPGKITTLIGVQLACGGVYIWLLDIIMDIYQSLKLKK